MTVPLGRLPRLIGDATALVLRAARTDLLVVAVLQLGQGVTLGGVLLAVNRLLENVLAAGSFAQSFPMLALLVALMSVSGILGVVVEQRDQVLTEIVSQSAQRRILETASDLDYVAFETPAVHDALQRASVAAESGPLNIVQGLVALIGAVAAAAGAVVALWTIQPLLVPFVVATAAPLIAVAAINANRQYEFFVELTGADRRRRYLGDLLAGRDAAKEVRLYGLGGRLSRRWEALSAHRLRLLRRLARRQVLRGLAASTVSSMLLGAAVVVLVLLIQADRLGVAQAGAAAAGTIMLAQRAQGATMGVSMLLQGASFSVDLQAFLDRGSDAAQRRGTARPGNPSRITVDRVSFRYPSAEGAALRTVSLDIEAGTVTALVGENGSGKSTLAALLCGLHLPTEGRVLWDGTDTASMDPAALFAASAVVCQDFVRYRLPAGDNIDLAATEPPAGGPVPPPVRAAAAAAGIDAVLTALPGGYGTVLGPQFDGGTDLSGGQWQRLALARAFFRDPAVLILDEPSAALDPRAERDLFDTVRTLFRGRTVVLVTHRFGNVRDADHIVVMRGGEVAERGDHDVLMAQGGLYAELFALQAAGYDERPARPQDRQDAGWPSGAVRTW